MKLHIYTTTTGNNYKPTLRNMKVWELRHNITLNNCGLIILHIQRNLETSSPSAIHPNFHPFKIFLPASCYHTMTPTFCCSIVWTERETGESLSEMKSTCPVVKGLGLHKHPRRGTEGTDLLPELQQSREIMAETSSGSLASLNLESRII
jgi:hypothetical protein